MPRTTTLVSILAATWLATGCAGASSRGAPVHQLPGIAHPDAPGVGQLVVETERLEFSDDTFTYFPHGPYEIVDLRGRLIRREANHLGEFDETPTVVDLAPGSYRVRARSKNGVIVVRDVEIQVGLLTRTDVAGTAADLSPAYATR
jgi:hypothetical protein